MKTPLKKILKPLLVGLLVAACAYVLKPGFVAYTEHRGEVRELKAEIKRLELERERLEEKMRALEEEDPELIERLAREKLHLSKPGEMVFRFKEEK